MHLVWIGARLHGSQGLTNDDVRNFIYTKVSKYYDDVPRNWKSAHSVNNFMSIESRLAVGNAHVRQ